MQKTAYILLVRLMRIFKITDIKRILLYFLFSVITCGLVLLFPKCSANGVSKGIEFCLNVLVPSLFPFMVLSSFIITSGVYRIFSKPLGVVTRILFKLPAECGSAVLLSLIGGYPVGARSIGSLYQNGVINNKQAEKIAYFCVCSGPGFLITFVGSTLYSNIKIGIILLISSVISVIICGIITRFTIKTNIQTENNSIIENTRNNNYSASLIKSVTDGTKAIVDMCSMVVVFNVLISFTDLLINNENIKNLSYILFEVTTACNNLSGNTSVTVVAFAIGFGGLCVHFQIFQGIKDININKWLFFLYRILQGIITAFTTKILLYFFPITKQVFNNMQNKTVVFSSSNCLGSLMLLITAVCFLYSIKLSNNKIGG